MGDLYDKHGIPIKEFDVLKMFHFTGARRKKYYMYKWVREWKGRLYGSHLQSNEHNGFLLAEENAKLCEIVQGYDPQGDGLDFNDRPRKRERENEK